MNQNIEPGLADSVPPPTEIFDEAQRFATLRENFARGALAVDLIDRSGGRPRIDLTLMRFGPVAVGTLAATPTEFVRERHHIKDSSGPFALGMMKAGSMSVTHAGNERLFGPGAAALLHHGRPWRAIGATDRYWSVTIPAVALKALVRHPEDRAGKPVPPGPLLRLLDGYLASIMVLGKSLSADLAPTVGSHLVDLVASVVGPTADAVESITTGGVKAARVQMILAEIRRRSGDPRFDLDHAAATLGLSRRYVQHLLEQTGKSFTEHLQERRLGRAYEMLTDSRRRHLAIIEVAYGAGFGDISHFNRMFRRRYGDTPTAVRAAASRNNG